MAVLAAACGMAGGCRQKGEERETVPPVVQGKPLPATFLGDWSYSKPWVDGHETPCFWGEAHFSPGTFSISEGERSKDSGSWSVEGVYGVASGEGTRESPYILKMHVEKGGGDGSMGYPLEAGPARSGDLIEGKVYLDAGRLTVELPRHGLELDRAAPAGDQGDAG